MGWISYPRAAGSGGLNVPVYGLQSNGGAPGGLQFGMSAQPVQTVGSTQMPAISGPSLTMLAQLLRGPSATAPAPASAPDPVSIMAAVPAPAPSPIPNAGPASAAAPADPSAPTQGSDPFAAARQAVTQHRGAPLGKKSDRRLKSEISRVGTLPNGLPVYRYRLEGGPFEIGCMADEVARVRPDATWFDPDDGFARVDYAKVL